MTFLSRFNKSELRKKTVETLLGISEPIAGDDPAIQPFKALCESHGITRMPELRRAHVAASMALVPENKIIISEHAMLGSPASVTGIAAHEMGHLVFNDDNRSTPQMESRADRFCLFLTGDASGFIEHLKGNESMRTDEREMFDKLGWKGRLVNYSRDRQQKKSYKPLEERLDDLSRPITAEESATFQQAIAEFNARQTVSTDVEEGKTGPSGKAR